MKVIPLRPKYRADILLKSVHWISKIFFTDEGLRPQELIS